GALAAGFVCAAGEPLRPRRPARRRRGSGSLVAPLRAAWATGAGQARRRARVPVLVRSHACATVQWTDQPARTAAARGRRTEVGAVHQHTTRPAAAARPRLDPLGGDGVP